MPSVPKTLHSDKLEALRSGFCPFCNAVKYRRDGEPLRMIAKHIQRKHHIHAKSFKDSVGLTYGVPLCSPETSRKLKERALRNDVPSESRREALLRGARKGGRQLSRARREYLVQLAKKLNAVNRFPAGSLAVKERNKNSAAAKSRNAAIWFKHGTRRGYEVYRCRCAKCTEAIKLRRRRYIAANRANFNLRSRAKAAAKRLAKRLQSRPISIDKG